MLIFRLNFVIKGSLTLNSWGVQLCTKHKLRRCTLSKLTLLVSVKVGPCIIYWYHLFFTLRCFDLITTLTYNLSENFVLVYNIFRLNLSNQKVFFQSFKPTFFLFAHTFSLKVGTQDKKVYVREKKLKNGYPKNDKKSNLHL